MICDKGDDGDNGCCGNEACCDLDSLFVELFRFFCKGGGGGGGGGGGDGDGQKYVGDTGDGGDNGCFEYTGGDVEALFVGLSFRLASRFLRGGGGGGGGGGDGDGQKYDGDSGGDNGWFK